MTFCVLSLLSLFSPPPCSASASIPFTQQSSCSAPMFSPGQSAVRQNGTVAVAGIADPAIYRQPLVLTNDSTVLSINFYPDGDSLSLIRIAAALFDSSFPALNSTKLAQTVVCAIEGSQFPTDIPTPLHLNLTSPTKLPAGNYSIVWWTTRIATEPPLKFFAGPMVGIDLDFFPTNNTGLEFNADDGVLPSPRNTTFVTHGFTGPGFITGVNVESVCSPLLSSIGGMADSGSPSVMSFSPLSVLLCLVMAIALSNWVTME